MNKWKIEYDVKSGNFDDLIRMWKNGDGIIERTHMYHVALELALLELNSTNRTPEILETAFEIAHQDGLVTSIMLVHELTNMNYFIEYKVYPFFKDYVTSYGPLLRALRTHKVK